MHEANIITSGARTTVAVGVAVFAFVLSPCGTQLVIQTKRGSATLREALDCEATRRDMGGR